jgi:pimeloyl-ACP methyl ester carboxylesterase
MSDRQHTLTRLTVPTGGEVEAYLSYPQQPQESAILFVHGFGSGRGGEKAVALEAECARHGLTFASFDFRGHGQSTGTLLELRGSGLLADLEAVHAYLAERGVRRLGLVGSSMGGWASAWFAVRHPEAVASVVLIAPAFNFVRARWASLTEPQRQHWRQTGRLRVRNEWLDTEIGYGLVEEIDQFPMEDLAAKWARPLLIFHGMNDQTIPCADSLDFVQRAAFPTIELRLLKSGDHRLSAFKEELAEAACRFSITHQ